MLTCFYCDIEIATDKYFTVSGESFHWACVRSLTEEYITDRRQRETHIDRQAEADEEKAKRLGFCCGFRLENYLDKKCLTCGQLLKLHMSDYTICPNPNTER